jgi:hypothetical protein
MNTKLLIYSSLLIGFLLIVGCEYEAPTSLWDPDEAGLAPTAVIDEIIPPNEAAGGANEIEILGSNFASDLADNVVYFGNVQAELISAESGKLLLYRPNLVAENIAVKVLVPGALMIAKVTPYTITPVLENYTEDFNDTGNLRAFAIDRDGTYYVIMRDKTIRRRSTDSKKEEEIGEVSQRSIGRLRFGPDGNLYYIRANNTNMYKFFLDSLIDVQYAVFPGNVNVFDFDENGIAYVGGNGQGLLAMKSPDDISQADDYTQFNILAIRVYQGAVYVLAETLGNDELPLYAIWRNIITGDGTLSERELFLDWSATEYGEAGAIPADIEFASDGALLISSDFEQPIILVSNGWMRPLYKEMISGPVTQLDWGPGDYLYFFSDVSSVQEKNVFKADMGQPGAPHYGR